MMLTPTTAIAVIGLGHVSLPLAMEFGKRFRNTDCDFSKAKIKAYRRLTDPTSPIGSDSFIAAVPCWQCADMFTVDLLAKLSPAGFFGDIKLAYLKKPLQRAFSFGNY